MTPDGQFDSISRAAEFYQTYPKAIERLMDRKPDEYYRLIDKMSYSKSEDQLEKEEEAIDPPIYHPRATTIDLRAYWKSRKKASL